MHSLLFFRVGCFLYVSADRTVFSYLTFVLSQFESRPEFLTALFSIVLALQELVCNWFYRFYNHFISFFSKIIFTFQTPFNVVSVLRKVNKFDLTDNFLLLSNKIYLLFQMQLPVTNAVKTTHSKLLWHYHLWLNFVGCYVMSN